MQKRGLEIADKGGASGEIVDVICPADPFTLIPLRAYRNAGKGKPYRLNQRREKKEHKTDIKGNRTSIPYYFLICQIDTSILFFILVSVKGMTDTYTYSFPIHQIATVPSYHSFL